MVISLQDQLLVASLHDQLMVASLRDQLIVASLQDHLMVISLQHQLLVQCSDGSYLGFDFCPDFVFIANGGLSECKSI